MNLSVNLMANNYTAMNDAPTCFYTVDHYIHLEENGFVTSGLQHCVSVMTIDDGKLEATRSFTVKLEAPFDAVSIDPNVVTIQMTDNDGKLIVSRVHDDFKGGSTEVVFCFFT